MAINLNGKLLVVVPARGGSKEIPLKNLRKLADKSLIEYVANIVANIPNDCTSVVSTDNEEIAKESEKFGLRAPFRRPKELSGDLVSDLDVLRHAVTTTEELQNVEFSYIMMLQPTCPLRKIDHVLRCLEKIAEQNIDSVWTVSPVNLKFHPMKQLILKDNHLSYQHPKAKEIIARQQLETTYYRNGACYIWRRHCLMNENELLPQNSTAIEITEPLVNIDTLEDLAVAEQLVLS